MRARARAQAAVGAWADDPKDRVFADEMRAVVDGAVAREGGAVGLGEGGWMPHAVERAPAAEQAGEQGEYQCLDGMAQTRVRGAVPLTRFGGLALGGGPQAGGWVIQ
jgi:hypothetical protein